MQGSGLPGTDFRHKGIGNGEKMLLFVKRKNCLRVLRWLQSLPRKILRMTDNYTISVAQEW